MEDAVDEHGASATRLPGPTVETMRRVEAFFAANPGASARAASRALGCSTPTVLKYMGRLDIPIKARPKRSRDEREAQVQAAVARIAAGELLTDVARDHGRSRITVYRDLASLEIKYERLTKYPPVKSRACAFCGETFRPKRDQAGRGDGKYCSFSCRSKGRVVSSETRAKLRETTGRWWRRKSDELVKLLERRGASPAVRKKWGQIWGGHTEPAPTSKTRGNQPLDPATVARVLAVHAAFPRMGIRAISRKLTAEGTPIGKSSVAEIIAADRVAKVSAKSSP